MARDKAHPFQMRVSSDWLGVIDGWRRIQSDVPSRAEAVRRLVGMGLRFGIKPGDKVSTPVGSATIREITTALGRVSVVTKNGDGHSFLLREINALDNDS
jgi:hypothetical protein